MREIRWSFSTSSEWFVDHAPSVEHLIQDYDPFNSLTKDVIAERKGAVFTKCPAHTDFIKNTFIIRAPFDLTINSKIDPITNDGELWCDNLTQEQFEQIIDTRFLFNNERGINPWPIIGIDWLYCFTSDVSTTLQIMPAFMHRNQFVEKTIMVPGQFDISKWVRNVETAFEVRSNNERIEIKKGDAIMYAKFLCDEPVRLVKEPIPWEEMHDCNEIKSKDRNRPLQNRYEEYAKVRAAKCPYPHDKQD